METPLLIIVIVEGIALIAMSIWNYNLVMNNKITKAFLANLEEIKEKQEKAMKENKMWQLRNATPIRSRGHRY